MACVTSTRPPGMGSGCTHSAIGGSGHLCLPTSSHLGQSGGEVVGPPLPQNDSDSPRVAKHAFILGPGDHVQPDPPQPAQYAQPSIRLHTGICQT